ncbi:allantoate amidohydrolase [Xanthomonas hortorum]|uniref:N-carbamoyl-L-amino acid hydrolase n=3 Tax=Xanthomonas hortorum TaxID=56454 RepID=A0A6V7BIJ8_9XANT|nr:allantoate amidohydrolase [Xanthomonas hortorum]MCC4626360.1 allantoate amidohydrolase [Xanthomonas campestris pv. nigromaculans]APP78435.1 allantoate amidohydrolase [Xanthomonas hortorum pv. gardneri]EGD18700.1 amidase, hydantoinase/carbamoylase family [Xanthomonas hortorum ATCC 19865]KLA93644.1 allantoate amidohydrolase [Xanthomonas hortorum pv. gardneri]KLA97120.1 allantoate amidohydrolase [Xanthomonas hortorum pv. gardneri]
MLSAPITAATDHCSGARAVARCDALGVAPYSDTPGGLFRAWLSPAHRATTAQVSEWMRQAGMQVRLDAAANLIGRYDGAHADAPALLIGSHLDSVRDAGRYDGPLGILLGIECVAALHAQGRRLPFAIEVIAFGDEEGSRFPASMFCSRAVAGTLDPATLAVVDADGVEVAAALTNWGLDIAAIGHAARAPGSVLAYLETHIEQGPVLEAEGLPVGIVTAIAAQRRFALRFDGRAGHAGTTTMGLRRDALSAAADALLAIERIARAGSDDLVATVGKLQVAPGATNVVPGRVDCTLDVRAGDDASRDAAVLQIEHALARISASRNIAIAIDPLQTLAASPCAPALIARLQHAVAAQGIAPRQLVSGAGHDAMVMAALCPTAMLFVRCAGGISHHPDEHVAPADAEVALAVMRHFIEHLGDPLVT